MKAEVEENGEAIIKGANYDPVSYAWAFNVLGDKCRVPEGAPVVRIIGEIGWNWESNIPRIGTMGT